MRNGRPDLKSGNLQAVSIASCSIMKKEHPSLLEFKKFLSARLGEDKKNSDALSKYHDLLDEPSAHRINILGWMFVLFKKILQAGGKKEPHTKNKSDDFVFDAFTPDYHEFSRLSNYYGNQYRGSFVLIYLLGALAVLAALVPVGFAFSDRFGHDAHHYAVWFTVTELVFILLILFIHKRGANPHGHGHGHKSTWLNQRWHERWIDYRILTERFRYMEILYPLGIDPLVEGVARGKELQYWVNAYFAMRLAQSGTARTQDLGAYKTRLLEVMEGQRDYHSKNSHRAELIHHRLHAFATWLFYGTLLACASHFILHNPILTLMAGFFPALAAAMHGILASGEFSKSAEVSKEMDNQIQHLIEQLKTTDSEEGIKNVAMEFHNMAIGEVDSWRSIFKDKNVPLA